MYADVEFPQWSLLSELTTPETFELILLAIFGYLFQMFHQLFQFYDFWLQSHSKNGFSGTRLCLNLFIKNLTVQV